MIDQKKIILTDRQTDRQTNALGAKGEINVL